MDALLDLKEAAALLGISEDKLTGLVNRKIVPAYLIADKHLRFKRKELEALKDLLGENAGFSDERVFNKVFREVSGLEKFKEVLRANDIYLVIGIILFLVLIFTFFRFRM